MSIIDFERPKKVLPTKKHNAKYSSDSGIPGTFVPNMSEDDMVKWKGRHFRGNDERIEIRKTFQWTNGKPYPDGRNYYSQVLIVVRKNPINDPAVVISTNGKVGMNISEYQQFTEAINEANEILNKDKVVTEQPKNESWPVVDTSTNAWKGGKKPTEVNDY